VGNFEQLLANGLALVLLRRRHGSFQIELATEIQLFGCRHLFRLWVVYRYFFLFLLQ
jgi:hypothetical protein